MRQTWDYMGERFDVLTDEPDTYRDLVRSMLDYDDCYDELETYLEGTVGNSADLLIKMVWEGAERTADALVGGFVCWLLDDMDMVAMLVERNCTLIEEAME